MSTIKINREQTRENNRKAGAITSFLVHLVILVLMFINLFTYPTPPPGQEGIQVAFGVPDVGNNTEQPSESSETATTETEEEVVEQEVQEVEQEIEQEVVEPEVEPEPVEPKKAEVPPVKPDVPDDVITNDNSKEIALKKEKERKKREEDARKKAEDAKEKAEADAKKRAADAKKKAADAKKKAAAEKKRKAAEAKAKADAERKRKEAEAKALKDKLSGGFKKKTDGGGKGNNGKPGNTGSNTGDPNSDNIGDGGKGKGKSGRGADLKGRNALSKPVAPKNPTQKSGVVVIKICVDRRGNVTSATYTQKGSTLNDSKAISTAIKDAKGWKFNPASNGLDEQCGSIRYVFGVN